MRIPLSWIREHTQFPESGTAEDLMAELVRVGLEEEDVHTSELTGPIVVGEVLEKTPSRRRTARPSTGAGCVWSLRAVSRPSQATASIPVEFRESSAAPTTSRSATKSS